MENILGVIGLLVPIIGGLTAVITFLTLVFKFFRRLDEMEKKIDKEAGNRQSGQERTHLLIKGVCACLSGLQQQGKNGPVTEALNELTEYQARKASE